MARRALSIAVGGLLASLSFSTTATMPPSPTNAQQTPSIFELYELNRKMGVANFITEDLLLVSYGLVRVAVGRSLERERYVDELQRLVDGLHAAVAKEASRNAASRANQDYLAVLAALVAGRSEVAGSADPRRAQAELDRVLAAREVAASPLWGYRIDYGQFLPRGYYEGDETLERHFRATRYAGAALFAVKSSRATGVGRSLSNRMAQQAQQLARLIDTDPQLAKARQELLASLAWRFGPAEDITLAGVLAVPPKPRRTHAPRLFAHAQEHDMQPRIAGGIVDHGRLEEGVSPLDVLTGWRLLPQRRTADYAAFQQLVFDGTGVFEGRADDEQGNGPFGLAMVDGQAVKAFPLLAELMGFWGSAVAVRMLEQREETAFADYAKAAQQARQSLAAAQGLAALHQQFIQTGLASGSSLSRLTALRAFWTWQRYVALLYAKQSYTPAGKGLPATQPRSGARVEPSLALYQSLARIVAAHREHTPHPSWDAFAEVLALVAAISSRQLLLGAPTAEDERRLNSLDAELKRVTGGGDLPIVVDVHVNPSSSQVLQEATGWAVVVRNGAARGARFTQYESKRSLDERLTDAQWRDSLAARHAERAVADAKPDR